MTSNQQKKESLNTLNQALDKYKYIAMMFYDGTPCPMILLDSTDVKDLENLAESLIVAGFKDKMSLKDQITLYTNELKSYTKRMEQDEKKNGICSENILSEKESGLWWSYCYCLLRLKVIKNDNNFGLYVVQQVK